MRHRGMLKLVRSRFEPVFQTPMPIEFERKPTVGEPFEFNKVFPNHMPEPCHLSLVRAVQYDSERPIMRVETVNSVYLIESTGV